MSVLSCLCVLNANEDSQKNRKRQEKIKSQENRFIFYIKLLTLNAVSISHSNFYSILWSGEQWKQLSNVFVLKWNCQKFRARSVSLALRTIWIEIENAFPTHSLILFVEYARIYAWCSSFCGWVCISLFVIMGQRHGIQRNLKIPKIKSKYANKENLNPNRSAQFSSYGFE